MNALRLVGESCTLPLPGGRCRPARTPEEVRYARALEANAHARTALGSATAALLSARRALYAAVAEHGPEALEVAWAHRDWMGARAQLRERAADVDATDEEFAAALEVWAAARRAAP